MLSNKQNKKVTNIAVIGAGYMGRSHSHAYRNLVNHSLNPKLYAIATSNLSSAKKAADDFGFDQYTDDWRELCLDKNVDIICVATPVHLHFEQAKLALENKKHLSLEKPLFLNLGELKQIYQLNQKARRKINIGYNYIHNPMIYYAKKLLNEKKIGDLVSFRVAHSEDFLASQNAPFKPWHISSKLGGGVLRDVGSHPLALINYLIGEVREVCAISKRQFKTRLNKLVNLEDHVDALLHMGKNLQGTLTSSWINSGRGMNLGFEIYGTKGAICFNQERLNELEVYLVNQSRLDLKGGLTIRSSSHHKNFSLVCPGDEHGIGFLDLKILESKDFLDAIANNKNNITSFDLGCKVEQQINAIYQSIENKNWFEVDYAL